MSYTDRDSGEGCDRQNESTEVVNVAMNNIVGSELRERSQQSKRIRRALGALASQDAAAGGQYLLVVICRFGGLNEEVERVPGSVRVAKHMHEPRFNATAMHSAYNMEYANGLCHR
jgi:hypothetical protein